MAIVQPSSDFVAFMVGAQKGGRDEGGPSERTLNKSRTAPRAFPIRQREFFHCPLRRPRITLVDDQWSFMLHACWEQRRASEMWEGPVLCIQ